jgi:hypothetical protein
MSSLAISVSRSTFDRRSVDPATPSVRPAMARKILLIEPNISLLSAETLLLTGSDYSVTPAFSHSELFILRDMKAVALAIISDSLGRRLLGAVAETVRQQWPLARILILGRAATMLEDQLYDEQVDRSAEPKQLLEDLERLYKDSWIQSSDTIAWKGGRSCACTSRLPLLESDPTKALTFGASEDKNVRDTPCGIRYRPR